MHLRNKYLKTKHWFAAGLMTIAGNALIAQIPQDTVTYYDWSQVIDANPDTIYGIDFTKERIAELPFKLSKFNELRGLRLTKNKLSELPDYLKNFDSLRFLYVNKNDFTFFPNAIFHLEKLEYLDISRNQIAAIPKGIQNLQHLKYLDIWDNRLVKVDPALEKLKQIEFIDFRGTTFSATFVEYWTKAFPNAVIEFDSPCHCLD